MTDRFWPSPACRHIAYLWYRATGLGESRRSEITNRKTGPRAAGKHSKPACRVVNCWEAADDPLQPFAKSKFASMNWQKVHTVNDFFDCPRFGVADFEGRPHVFESRFDESADDYPDTFKLSPIDSDLFELVLRDWAIWERWLAEFESGNVTTDTHPCLPDDKPEHDRLSERIGSRFRIDPDNYVAKLAEFRQTSKSPRRLEVRWHDEK